MAGKDKEDGGTDKKGPSHPSLIELVELEERRDMEAERNRPKSPHPSLVEVIEIEERREAEAERNKPKSPYPSLAELAQIEDPSAIEGAQSHRTKAGRKSTTPLERIQEGKSPKGPKLPGRN